MDIQKAMVPLRWHHIKGLWRHSPLIFTGELHDTITIGSLPNRYEIHSEST